MAPAEEAVAPRLPLLTREGFPDDLKGLWDAGVDQPGHHLIRALGNSPRLLQGWVEMAQALWKHGGLTPEQRELVILRVAYISGSGYEWQQHVRFARQAGMDDSRIRAVTSGPASELFSSEEQVLLSYVDALMDRSTVAGGLVEEVLRVFGPGAVVGITLLVGVYVTTASFIVAAGVPLEDEFVGWDLEGP